MKILFVTPFLPSPPRFGGQRRLDGLMRGLSHNHDVSVLSFNRTDEWEHSSLEATRGYCREVVTLSNLDLTVTREKRALQAKSLLSLHSFEFLLAARRQDFQKKFEQMLSETKYDVVQVEFAQMAAFEFPEHRSDGPVFVLDEHNIEFDILRRTARAKGELSRHLYNRLNWRKLAREERSAWRRFDAVTLTSRRDEEIILSEYPTARTAVVPNGVDVAEFSVSSGPVEPEMLLFFGACNYHPNHDGIVHFIDDIFPKIRARHPNARFCIMGPGARQSVLDRAGNGVEVLGMVDEVGPYIERAAAVVVPLRLGGGTRLKIVEALSKGKPVISTTLGAEGIDVVHAEHLLLADEPEDFAKQVGRVLSDRELGERLGRAGRQLMEDKYSWRSIVAGLERFYEARIQTR
ncbi:MAG TPA: glycosyltransferase family 4 protein [Polyangiaceae bacterium]|jgi:glycosyltransferase involved in cell wall biosynthesis